MLSLHAYFKTVMYDFNTNRKQLLLSDTFLSLFRYDLRFILAKLDTT